MADRRRQLGLAVIGAMLTTVLAACGGTAGVAQREPTTQSSSADGAEPEPAPPSTAPAVTVAEPPTVMWPVDETRGRVLEAMRLANQLPLVSSVDPSLVQLQDPTRAMVLTFPDHLGLFGKSQIDALHAVGGYVAGYIATRHTVAADLSVALAVMEFDTPEQAAAAAAAVPTPRGAEPIASTVPGAIASRLVDEDGTTVSVATSAGPLMLFVHTWTVPGQDGLPMADKGLTVLTEGMAGFRTTPSDQRTLLLDDPDGVVSHTLAGPSEVQPAWLTAHGRLHSEWDQARAATAFDNSGVDVVTDFGRANVFRAADAPRAVLLQADALARVAANQDSRRTEIDGLPDGVTCLHDLHVGLNCAGSYGRHTFLFAPVSREEAVEVATRQYSLLVQLESR